ncbi:MAG: 3-dehydroquinate synthase [Bacteroidia bacterium]|nr:MAG: 3-dehydroquinate synthase [Bacteroidia bacterium]
MEKLTFKASSGSTEILIGADWKSIIDKMDLSRAIIITDHNIRSIYGSYFPRVPVIALEPGEGSKSIDTIDGILKELLILEADRSSFLLGIGGGVICDITGFAATIYMRGIRFGFVSTTLLSQVDASIGGKNGVNLSGVKNIVGTFAQPEFVICDQNMLATLPEAEYASGLGELVKYALIRDEEMLGFIEENIDAVIAGDREILKRLIYRSVEIKAEIAGNDEREVGERRLLNFGHTVGHGIEVLTGLPHGVAISHGMMIAAEFSFDDGLIDIAGLGRVRSVLERMGLLPGIITEKGAISHFILKDKKREDKNINFVFLEKPGKAVVKMVALQDIIDKLAAKDY